MNKTGKLLLGVALLLSFWGQAGAAVIYNDNNHPNQLGGVNFGEFAYSDDFIIRGRGGDALITDAHFYTLEPGNIPVQQVYYAFFNDAGGTPGSMLDIAIAPVTKVATGVAAFGGSYAEYLYGFDLITPLLVQQDTTYWFTVYIVNATNVYWEAAGSTLDPNNMAARGPRQLAGPWAPATGDLAFYLTGPALPAPAPLALLLLGGVLIPLARRRK